MHALELGAIPKDPAWQIWQADEPENAEKLAVGHSVHLVATNEEYEPTEQFMHTVEPLTVWNVPAPQ